MWLFYSIKRFTPINQKSATYGLSFWQRYEIKEFFHPVFFVLSFKIVFGRNHSVFAKNHATLCFWGQEPSLEYACITKIIFSESQRLTGETIIIQNGPEFFLNKCTVRSFMVKIITVNPNHLFPKNTMFINRFEFWMTW